MIKITDLEYFIFIAFTLKFGVKSLLAEGGDTGWGYTSFFFNLFLFITLSYYSQRKYSDHCKEQEFFSF